MPSNTESKRQLGPPVVPFLTPFLGGSFSTEMDHRRKTSWYPYSNLSTGGPTIPLEANSSNHCMVNPILMGHLTGQVAGSYSVWG